MKGILTILFHLLDQFQI